MIYMTSTMPSTITTQSEHWGVVGGGILGMTLALRLAQQGKSVTLYEAADHLGGLADAWQLGDVQWDRHYHVTLLSDLHLRRLLEELGLEQDMQWVETKTGFYTDDVLYSMSNSLEFLRFPPLGLLDKLRLGFTIVYGSRLRDWKRLETLTATQWLKQLSGPRTFQKIWLPLLRAKLGDNYSKASASFIWAIIARMYAARRTGLKKEMFGYLPGGYARMLERFGRVLEQHNVQIQVGHRVQQVRAVPTGVQVDFTNGHSHRLDQVVLTTAAPLISQLCPDLLPSERDRFNNVQYQGIVCASLLLKNPLGPYYVTNITDTWVPFTGVIEMSALVDRHEFGGNSLVYLPKYVDPSDPIFQRSDAEIQEQFLQALERMYPHFDRQDLLSFRLSRVRHVFAITTLNYSDHLPPMHVSIPGVHVVNSAHIPNGTLNVNESVQLANRTATELKILTNLVQSPVYAPR
jgi:protoporphyrinogen oxidase